MFDFFKRQTAEDYKHLAEDIYKVPPVMLPVLKENYRVGCTDDGMTTLTLMDNALTMTLTLNQTGCEQLIRMLRATYYQDTTTEETEE
jgi:hypothetical protein